MLLEMSQCHDRGIEPPRFSMFQQVRCSSQIATVVGVEYTSFIQAVAIGTNYTGWSYTLSFIDGLPQQEVLDRLPSDLMTVCECDLTAVGGEA
ncbi:MAG TPA: hypothetical protein VKP88_07000 [Candidatus Paceibacterota bacterium]|nr:hypothetical protein [Candidatus Paceibacterota bacterium]